ncbi:aminoacyltransferase [Enterococcus faecalis]|nr:peptidoglycan bridge formation glycyltransferase FemA/FemB family protein [Enterococcus faecalis]EIY5962562.1 peptidoglycan bridge formation glycyltransferase FemA/FemB family protein [Enterococcus faecalis]MBP4070136.1 peptidoglycan bridge formation glycyltransferase FemA/FemB family protein [Enterococcus faecalis]MBP4101013.1 peptidoglycan bridge formation glycyltransferase FemA/FemB family protein [Enterococcus faecalis]NSV96028.1 peptidoglycan bridge formation glycyltransferase FemA/FemB
MSDFVELTNDEFYFFSYKHPQGSYLQSLEMCKLLQKRKWQTVFVGLKRKQKIIAAALMAYKSIKIGKYYSISAGPLMNYEDNELVIEFFFKIKKYIKKNHGLLLKVTPNYFYQHLTAEGVPLDEPQSSIHKQLLNCGLKHNGFTHTYINDNPRVIFKKNLTGFTERDLLKSYHSSTRTKVNKSIKSGMTIHQFSREELPLFEDVMHHTASRQNFQDKGLSYYQDLYDSFGNQAKYMAVEINFNSYVEETLKKIKRLKQKKKKIYTDISKSGQKKNIDTELIALEKRLEDVQEFLPLNEKNKNKILAVGLFIECPEDMIFLFGGMYKQYKNFLSPSYFLQHIMMKQAIDKGLTWFNLYGVEGVYDGSDGVLNFKKGFGGVVEEQLGTYRLIVNPIKYNIYQVMKTVYRSLKN